MAETYHVLDIEQLPVKTAAALVFGLRENSRVKMAMRGESYSQETLLLATICDRITNFMWMMSSQQGEPPKSILKMFLGMEKTSDIISFDSAEDFKAEWDRITKGGG